MEPEFVDCTNLWMLKEEIQEVEDVTETDTVGEEDCMGVTRQIKEEDDTEPFKLELEDEMHDDSCNPDSPAKRNDVFPCTRCNMTYTSSRYLKRHDKRCRGPKKPVVKVQFELDSTDVQSLVKIIDGVKMYCCQFCAYKTKHLTHVKDHLVSHTETRPYQCELCGKTFTYVSSVRKHLRIHTEGRQYQCTQCDKAFYRAGELKRHNTTHTGEKVFACKHCEFVAASSGDLSRHARTHSGETPFSCTLCCYKGKQNSVLQAHILRRHTEVKPYVCVHCGHRVAVKTDLVRHMRIKHVGDSI